MKNSKNTNKRELKAAETKKKIYESARQLALAHGIDNVSVDSIVKAAGVSKGSFYVHFRSKDALTADFVNKYTRKADLDYRSFLSALPDDISAHDVLILLAGEISDFIDTTIGLENMKVLYKAHLTKTIDTTTAMSYNRELYKLFTEVLERGVRQGELRDDLPVDVLAKHLIMAIRGLTFEWCIRHPDYDLKEQVQDYFAILIDGLKK